jgi:hypothetical protein
MYTNSLVKFVTSPKDTTRMLACPPSGDNDHRARRSGNVRWKILRRNGVLIAPKTVRLPVRYSTAATSTPRSSRHAVSEVRKRPNIAANVIGQTVGPYDQSVNQPKYRDRHEGLTKRAAFMITATMLSSSALPLFNTPMIPRTINQKGVAAMHKSRIACPIVDRASIFRQGAGT